jgi:hypothetical protein
MPSLLNRDHYPENILDALEAVQDRLADLERTAKTGAATFIEIDTTDVSNPPTDAELDAIFGTPDEAGAGFTALVNDNSAGSNEYLVWSDGSAWWYASGTKAT